MRALTTPTVVDSGSSNADLRQALNSYREMQNLLYPFVQHFYDLSSFLVIFFFIINLKRNQVFPIGWELLFRILPLPLPDTDPQWYMVSLQTSVITWHQWTPLYFWQPLQTVPVSVFLNRD